MIYIGTLHKSKRPNLPVAGRRSIFEPDWLARLRFIRNSREIIQDGYNKVFVPGGNWQSDLPR